MNFRLAAALAAVLLAVACRSAIAGQSPTPPVTEVRQGVEQWLKAMEGKEYQATLRARDGTSPLQARQVNDRLFSFQEGNLSLGIGFSQPPKTNSTLKELQATFAHLALDRLPVPGMQADNWETRLMTPVSSFKEGVTLESWEAGVLRVRVRTTFFAVSGRRTDIRVPADAPMPEGAYFQIRQPLKADLVIEGRLFP